MSELFLDVILMGRLRVSESADLLQDTVFKRELLKNGRGVPDAIGCKTLRFWLSRILHRKVGLQGRVADDIIGV